VHRLLTCNFHVSEAGRASIERLQIQVTTEATTAGLLWKSAGLDKLFLSEFVSLSQGRCRPFDLISGCRRRGEPARCQLRTPMLKRRNQPLLERPFRLNAVVSFRHSKLHSKRLPIKVWKVVRMADILLPTYRRVNERRLILI
jgi:hypothetical protein